MVPCCFHLERERHIMVIETKRLLREMTPADYEALYAVLADLY